MSDPKHDDFAATEFDPPKFNLDAPEPPAVSTPKKPPPDPRPVAAPPTRDPQPVAPSPPPPLMNPAAAPTVAEPTVAEPLALPLEDDGFTALDRPRFDTSAPHDAPAARGEARGPRRSSPPPARVAPMPRAPSVPSSDVGLYAALAAILLLIVGLLVALAAGLFGGS